MRAAVLYPPFQKNGEYPLLSQNRHLKFSRSREVRIFPLVPASLATLLKTRGHEVLFLDGINRRMSASEYDAAVRDFCPDIVFLETKAPLIPLHWEYIRRLKNQLPRTHTVLMGDHVTYFPVESFEQSPVDFVVTGGDYDATGAALCDHLDGRGALPPGVFFRKPSGEATSSGAHRLIENLDTLPFIDRELTRFQDYGEAYLLRPVAYLLTGRGCGAPQSSGGGVGLCTFCIWQHAFWDRTARLRSPANVAAEMEWNYRKFSVAEFFDDNESGPLFSKSWLRAFRDELKRRKLIGKFRISSNCRADTLDAETADLLVDCGWRLLKIGLESGNSETLKRLAKCEDVERIKQGVKLAKDKGLVVLLTTMLGYPWETEEEARRTYETAKELLLYKPRTGDCLQASTVVAYPGSPLHRQALQKGWLVVPPADYAAYDMSRPVLKTSIRTGYWTAKTWKLMSHPKFLWGTLTHVRHRKEVDLLWRGLRSLLGHVRDYPDAPSIRDAGRTQTAA